MHSILTNDSKLMKRIASLVGVFALMAALLPATASAQTMSLSQIQSGDLIRGETFTAVYYFGKDGMRYVFPNTKTYFTWYENFDNVKWISDADLGSIQIGGNVTYRPGVKMIKITSDPKTYAVDEDGSLRWVTSEAVAISMYGSNWNTKIDDVADAFFGNYQSGSSIEDAGDFSPANATTEASSINKDRGMKAATVVSTGNSSFSPGTITIKRGTAVRFENMASAKHTATADDLSWGTGTLQTGQNFTRYFERPGTYTYHDTYNPDTINNGVIIVE